MLQPRTTIAALLIIAAVFTIFALLFSLALAVVGGVFTADYYYLPLREYVALFAT